MFGAREVDLNPIAPTAWITLADAKAYLGITGTDSDARLTAILAAVASQIEAYTAALVTQRTVTERMYPEDAVAALALTHYPVSSLTSFTIDDEAQTLGELRVANSGGMVRNIDGSAIAGAEIVAVYVAGYPSNAIPAALIEAAKQLTKDIFNGDGRDSGVAKESVPDVGSIEYRDGSTFFRSNGVAVSAEVAALLAPFVRRGV